ncbi:alpha/beta fold hydrolase [Plasticicumulans acidivorans]|uniref:Pimeloyl-ACP methyl ester carboxylesterase n=1 Tax=Plasticicumulans acidivorans TaxID=886464 RepID=A0A317MWJ3_9GAMM|nr:alpha/beta hydrolase [Plasticicumulans acidivorans]PWV63181.1 pimeloyl-ACP methyl ester carboxylesterase [Plasticicumulans acidivorans]
MEQQGYLQIDEARLEYGWSGPGPTQAPTLVLLHEGLGCLAQWRDFPERLVAATGCGVFAYTRAGYGGSSPVTLPRPKDYVHREALGVLPQVLDAVGIETAVLIGHSDGGSIALIHAGGVYDPRVRGAVTMAAHVFVEDVTLAGIRAARVAWEQRGLRERLAKYHGDNVDCAFFGWNDTWLRADFADWNLEHYLPAIHVPLLVMQGIDDEYGTPRQVEAIAAQTGGPVDARLLENCAHNPVREQPEQVLGLIADFVHEVTGRAA